MKIKNWDRRKATKRRKMSSSSGKKLTKRANEKGVRKIIGLR